MAVSDSTSKKRRSAGRQSDDLANAFKRTIVTSFDNSLAMPKEIKGNASRKPPEPTANHADIEEWFLRQMPHLQPIVRALDESIRATIPGLHYAVKWKRPYYGLPELGWIIELAAYDVSVNVLFLGGADFDSPPPLGTTDRTSYIKVTTLEETQQPELHEWIKEASRTPGWS